MMMEDGQTWWVIQTYFGGLIINADEEDARDQMTRKDKLFSFQISNLQERTER
jgi:hypothetical protein